MKASINAPRHLPCTFHNKQLTSTINLVVNTQTGPKNLITIKYYQAQNLRRVTTVYCAFWLNAGTLTRSGFGQCNAVGFDRTSGALAEALDAVGITLSTPISGRGSLKSLAALEAIARACGHHGKTLFIRN